MKVDTTLIEGYDSMTPEEKISALEGFELEPPKDEVNNLKGLLSKKNSELADLTKQLREKMTAEEKAEAERKEAIESRDARIKELEKKEKLSEFRNQYMGLGFSAEEASKQAELLYNGDIVSVIANHKLHLDNISKQAIADAITKSHLSFGEPPTPKEDDTALRKAMGLPV